MSFKMDLCNQKLCFLPSFFFSFSVILIGLLKDISFIDILRCSQHNNLLHNHLSKFVAACSECTWLECLCLVLRVAAGDEELGPPVLEHSSSPGAEDSQLFLNPFQSFLTLDIFLTWGGPLIVLTFLLTLRVKPG